VLSESSCESFVSLVSHILSSGLLQALLVTAVLYSEWLSHITQ